MKRPRASRVASSPRCHDGYSHSYQLGVSLRHQDSLLTFSALQLLKRPRASRATSSLRYCQGNDHSCQPRGSHRYDLAKTTYIVDSRCGNSKSWKEGDTDRKGGSGEFHSEGVDGGGISVVVYLRIASRLDARHRRDLRGLTEHHSKASFESDLYTRCPPDV